MIELFTNNWPYLVEGLALTAGLAAAGHAIMTKRDVRSAASWTAIVLLSPLVGAFLYVLLGVNRIRLKKVLRKRQAAGARIVPADASSKLVTNTVAPMPEQFLPMKRLGDAIADFSLLTGNYVTPFESGDDCYDSMLEAINHAKTWI